MFSAEICAIGSLFARAETAPAITYIVISVFSSKNAGSDKASFDGRSTSSSLEVSLVNGPVKNLSSVTAPFTGTPGLLLSINRLNFSGEAKFILQAAPELPSVILQPFSSKRNVRHGPFFTSKHNETGFFNSFKISFALLSSSHRFSSEPKTPYIFT